MTAEAQKPPKTPEGLFIAGMRSAWGVYGWEPSAKALEHLDAALEGRKGPRERLPSGVYQTVADD